MKAITHKSKLALVLQLKGKLHVLLRKERSLFSRGDFFILTSCYIINLCVSCHFI